MSRPKFKVVNEMKQEYLAEIWKDTVDTIYVKPGVYALSSKKIESLIKIAEAQKYYQCNPVRFIDNFFNIELLDSQAYIVQRSWTCPNVLLVCTRGFGKSTLTDLIIMSKDMLFNNFWSYIASGSGSQAETTFTTLERLANDAIDTMKGSTGYIFKAEIEVKNAAGDGFSHSSNGFSYNLYNGSYTETLNSNVTRKRGKRGNLVVFDECGWLTDDMMQVYAAFVIVNKGFATGKDRDGNSIDITRLLSMPTPVPNQLFYISSASSTDTEFYKLYRDFSKRMIMGDRNYFVAHIDCELAIKPTKNGKPVAPLLSRNTVETAMRNNPEKARREYYCEFTTDAGAAAIVKRGTIKRNEEIRVPLLCNDTGDKKFIITYDPARTYDNSVILVCEVYDEVLENGEIDKRMRIVNCINLLDVGKKIKSPMRTPDQVKYLKQIILDYNGDADAYGNILGIYIDAGSGGAGKNIADYLMEDWTDEAGIQHRGLIDKVTHEEYLDKFPNAVDKIRMIEPGRQKSEIFEAMIELMNQDKIKFTADYDNKGYLTVFNTDQQLLQKETTRILNGLKKDKSLNEAQIQEKLKKKLAKSDVVTTQTIRLSWQEEIALTNIDALKEEAVNMIRKPRESGKDSFELCPENANRLHDDRVYCLSLAAYGLMIERRKFITERKRQAKFDITKMISMSKKPKQWRKH